MEAIRPENSSLRATKSVSQLNCASDARTWSLEMATETRPSDAVRSLRLAALAMPRSRSTRMAASMSPPASSSAFLQSLMPTPVLSRSSLTSCAETLVVILKVNPLVDLGDRKSGVGSQGSGEAAGSLQRLPRLLEFSGVGCGFGSGGLLIDGKARFQFLGAQGHVF